MAKVKVQRPNRDPDHWSKRGVPYFWSPEWIRGTSSDTISDSNPNDPTAIILTTGKWCIPCASYGKIKALKDKKGNVDLHMKSQASGKYSYIQGSIQDEFKRWHDDRAIDYILLGIDPDELINED
jgi:hypothetical protein